MFFSTDFLGKDCTGDKVPCGHDSSGEELFYEEIKFVRNHTEYYVCGCEQEMKGDWITRLCPAHQKEFAAAIKEANYQTSMRAFKLARGKQNYCRC